MSVAASAPAGILFDATRLADRRRPGLATGVERVVLAYARWLQGQSLAPFTPVVSWSGRLAAMPARQFDRLVAEAASLSAAERRGEQDALWAALSANLGRPDQAAAALRSATARPALGPVRRAARSAARFLAGRPPASGKALYLNVGHSGLDRPGFVQAIAAQGHAIAVMIHDLIPITHPEFCRPDAAPRHVRRLEASLAHADLVIANSRATAADIAAYAKGWERRAPPMIVAPLGLAEAFTDRVAADAAAEASANAPVAAASPYFVFVGTIEARKNLALLLTVWRRLAELMGPRAPHLVLVGARGWENEAIVDHLDRSPTVRALVHEVDSLGDRHLAALLAGARALLAPSLAEGFDLPVMEALSLGCPVIASDIAVHRELALGARLVDPLDGPGWLAAIQDACAHPASRGAHPTPTWDEHFALVAEALGLIGGETRPAAAPARSA